MNNLSVKFPDGTSSDDKEFFVKVIKNHVEGQVEVEDVLSGEHSRDITIKFDEYNLFDRKIRGVSAFNLFDEVNLSTVASEFKKLLDMIDDIRSYDSSRKGVGFSVDLSNENISANVIEQLMEELDIEVEQRVADQLTTLVFFESKPKDGELPALLALYIDPMSAELRLVSYPSYQ